MVNMPLLTLTLPDTASVPATAVLPLAAATVNMPLLTFKSPVNALVDDTDRAPVISVALAITVTAPFRSEMVDTDDDVPLVLLLPGAGAGAVQVLPTAVKPNSQPHMNPLLLNCSLWPASAHAVGQAVSVALPSCTPCAQFRRGVSERVSRSGTSAADVPGWPI